MATKLEGALVTGPLIKESFLAASLISCSFSLSHLNYNPSFFFDSMGGRGGASKESQELINGGLAPPPP